MENEVRYHMLRPLQVVKRRKECPVAYIPIGTIEWHGRHNPLGADALQAEGLAVMCAQKGGGLVFPTLYYGENRLESLMEANSEDKYDIAKEMEIDADNFLPDKHPFSRMEQSLNYQKLLIHILAEVESLGFELGVIIAGHYPLIDHARSAVLQFNKHRYTFEIRRRMLAWACLDYLICRNKYPNGGDHAALWETSHMLYLHSETVDLNLLPPKGEKIIGVDGAPPQDATAEFGKETFEASCEEILKEVKVRLNNKAKYLNHGSPF